MWSAQRHLGLLNGFSPGEGYAQGGMFVTLARPGMRFLEIILLESPMSFSSYETAKSKLTH
jgi:hypothetical protein